MRLLIYGRVVSLKHRKKARCFASFMLFYLICATAAYPLPEVQEVASGTATFEQPSESTLNITASNQSIINYNSFNIGAGETVNFILPSADSFSLNRILGGGMSEISGNLFANGNLVLVNSDGFHFANTANIEVGGLIASTQNITNENFLAGNYIFAGLQGTDPSHSFILNEGSIQTTEGGMAILIADAIENRGTIEAPLGTVALAGGNMVSVGLSGDGLVSVAVDEATAKTILDKDGNPISDQIKNTGTLAADSGHVSLTAKAANQIFDKAINTEGYIRANQVVAGKDGTVEFVANGAVSTNGTIETSNLKIGEGTTVNANSTTFKIEKDWINQGVFNGDNSSVTFLGGNNTHSVYGANTFHDFYASGADRVIKFEAGVLQTITGRLDLEGEYAHLLKIHSIEEGAQYLIDIQGDYHLDFVDVRDSHQLGGDIVLITRSHSDGNILGWDADPEWTGGGGNALWSTGGNWSAGAAPGAGNTVTFTGDTGTYAGADNDSTQDIASLSIASLTIGSGYAGTITLSQGLGITGNFAQAGGTFALSSQNLDVDGTFTLSGGTFNANSGSLNVGGNFTISSGTFNEGTSTMTFDTGSATIDVNSSETFSALTFNSTGTKTFAASDQLIATGLLTLTDGSINKTSGPPPCSSCVGTVYARGNIIQNSGFDGGTENIVIDGSGDQTFTGNATSSAGDLLAVTVNKTSGTLTLSGTIRTTNNWTYTAGTVDATTNDSTVVFAGSQTVDGQGTSATMAFDNVTVNSSGTVTLGGNLDADGNLTVSSGTLDASSSNYAINVAGNWSNSGTFTARSGTVTFDGTSTSGTINPGSSSFYGLTFNGVGGAWDLTTNNLTVTNALTITNGTFDLNAKNLTATGATFSNDGTLRLQGGETVTGLSMDTNSGTVTYDGTTSYTGLAAGSSYYNLTFNGTGGTWAPTGAVTVSGALNATAGTYNANGQTTTVTGLTTVGGGTYQASTATQTFNGGLTVSSGTFTGSSGTVDVNGDLALSGGTLTAPSGAFTISGSWSKTGGTFTPGTNTVTFDSTASGKTITSGGSSFYNTTFNGVNGGWTLQDAFDADSNFTITNGTLNANGKAMTIGGNWSNSGTFTANSNTVTLDGTDQTISGSNTFYNLTKNVTTARTLTFEAGSTQTVTGTLNLQGAAGNLLSLRSGTSGTQWRIDPQGTRTISYLDVKDSNNINAAAIDAQTANVTNSGNNTNWTFAVATTTTNSNSAATDQVISQTASIISNIDNLIGATNFGQGVLILVPTNGGPDIVMPAPISMSPPVITSDSNSSGVVLTNSSSGSSTPTGSLDGGGSPGGGGPGNGKGKSSDGDNKEKSDSSDKGSDDSKGKQDKLEKFGDNPWKMFGTIDAKDFKTIVLVYEGVVFVQSYNEQGGVTRGVFVQEGIKSTAELNKVPTEVKNNLNTSFEKGGTN